MTSPSEDQNRWNASTHGWGSLLAIVFLLLTRSPVLAKDDDLAQAKEEADSYFVGATAQMESLNGYDVLVHVEDTSLYENRIIPTIQIDYRIRMNERGDDYFVAEYRKFISLKDAILGDLDQGILATTTWRLEGKELRKQSGRYAPSFTSFKSFSEGMRSGKIPCLWRIGQDSFENTTLANRKSETTLKRIFTLAESLIVRSASRKDNERVIQITADVPAGCDERYTWLFSESELLPVEFRIAQDCGLIFSNMKPIHHQQVTWEDDSRFGNVPVASHATSMILVRLLENGKEKQTESESYRDVTMQWRPYSIEDESVFSKDSYTAAEIEEMVRPQNRTSSNPASSNPSP